MGFTTPHKQRNYMGEHANDAAALTLIRANEWDSTLDGTGNPINGMWYYNTTTKYFMGYQNDAWTRIDRNAIHSDASGEISAITEKTRPLGADIAIIEDSAASNAKKSILLKNLIHALMVDQVFFHEEFIGVTISGAWQVTVTDSGIITMLESDGSALQLNTGATINSTCLLNWDGNYAVKASRNPCMHWLVNSTSSADFDVEMGVKGASHYAWFEKSASGNLFAKSYDGTEESTDCGQTLGTGMLRLSMEMTASEVKFYIGGVLKATHTTNIPTQRMQMHFYAENTVAATKSLYLRNVTWCQTRVG